uniref:(northern house mosquito) hypothetical protein n=1 Tax=Culex pipiens TaxID=7175 RepID=A0A8D8C7X2_CULPI
MSWWKRWKRMSTLNTCCKIQLLMLRSWTLRTNRNRILKKNSTMVTNSTISTMNQRTTTISRVKLIYANQTLTKMKITAVPMVRRKPLLKKLKQKGQNQLVRQQKSRKNTTRKCCAIYAARGYIPQLPKATGTNIWEFGRTHVPSAR